MSVALAQAVKELEATVEELQREVETLRAAKTGSLKETQCCPACGGRRILHFTRVTERSHGGVEPLALAHAKEGSFFVTIETAAPLQAFACQACGRVEWYASGLDKVEIDGEHVRLLSSDPAAPDAGPYR